MNMPEFPKEFIINHCPKVAEAKYYANLFQSCIDGDEESWAECCFEQRGNGMECQSCKLFLTRPFCGHRLDEVWLPVIEKFYRDSREYYELEQKECKTFSEFDPCI